ncbi:MAG: ABC-F type ribosomal protection protein [Clostridia bacterium]|nr:ABC-F type ribosomal protection protein [Clostridia bacterium]
MAMIKVDHLTFSYPGSYDAVFEDVSFQIDTDWKLGFIGRNGRGKTTFLQLLLGNYAYSGRIEAPVRFDYFPYSVEDPTACTRDVLEAICPQAAAWELERELGFLQVESAVLLQPFYTLSNGEQTKALLSALFLNEGHFLLIDEPTNHLDRAARKLVASYLKRKKGFILVSHDRAFLDGCVDHILSINRTDIEVQSGNFSSWMENFERQQSFEQVQNERLKKDMARLKEAARRSEAWSYKAETAKKGVTSAGLKPDKGYVGHKAAKVMKRAKATEARQQQAAAEKATLLQNAETAASLKLSPLLFHADRLAAFRDVTVCYGTREICSHTSFEVTQGARIALEGKNGSGKSSLLKLILGEAIPHTGTVSVASGLMISYVPQDTSGLCGLLSDYAKERQIDESLLKAILRKMDFSRVQFEKDMADFSGGQKKKVLIAGSLCQRAHLYIWDEPLNFIDVYSRMQIEALLQSFSPTMLFVEHDRVFQQNIATQTVVL